MVRRVALLTLAVCGCDIGLTAVAFDCGPNASLTREGTCRAVGVPPAECVEADDGRGGCVMTFEAACDGLSLPGAPCAPTCAFVEDPAQPGFPLITPVDTPTETVDFTLMPRLYVAPSESIAAAIAQALPEPPDDVITVVVLGRGVYHEDVVLDRPVVLWGACEHTTIVGQSPSTAAITVAPGVLRVGVAMLRVSGPGGGVRVGAGAEFGMGFMHLEGLGGVALRVDAGSSNWALDTRISDSDGIGVQVDSAVLLVRDSVIAGARGGAVVRATAAGEGPLLTIEHSAVVDAEHQGVLVEGGTLEVHDSLVQGSGGIGIEVARGITLGVDAHLELVRSVVQGSHDAGVDARDATVAIDRATIRDTRGRADLLGFAGDDCAGQGLRVRSDDASTVTNASITGSHTAGVFVSGTPLALSAVLVRDTLPESCSGEFGDGVQLYAGAGVTVESIRVEDSARAALAAFGADAFVTASVFGCSEHAVATEPFAMAGGSIDESGASVCGCAGVWERCRPAPQGLASWVFDPAG